MDVPVFLINGFLESGKSEFIQTTLDDPEFRGKERILVIVCEEGEVEYNEAALAKNNISVAYIEEREDFGFEKLEEFNKKYRPDRVLVELNGMWKMEELLEMKAPKGWQVVQLITIIDATTWNNYLLNMRGVMMEAIKYSDTIIFNRVDDNIKKLEVRRTIKPVNRKAQIIYETAEGIDTEEEEEELPFDIEANPIVIEEDDFGLWYLDILDFPKKYEGKTVDFKGMFYKDNRMPKDTFVPGRFAMQCCADDIQFIGFQARIPSEYAGFLAARKNKDWVHVTAKIKIEFKREYRGKGPVLYVQELRDDQPAEEEVVYFT